MLTFNEADVLAALRHWWWPLVRVSGFMVTAPIIGTRAVPRRVRIILALALTMLIVPVLPATQQAATPVLSATGLWLLAQQLTIGALLGVLVRLVFVVFEFAGQVIAQQMGLGFAAMVDPQSGMQVPVVSQLYIVLATLFFFAANVHHQLIAMLCESFRLLPIGEALGEGSLSLLVRWSADLIALAVVMMLPVIVALLVVNLIFAVMTRASPQLNVFAIGFPITLLGGVVMMLLTIGSYGGDLARAFEAAFQVARQALQST